MIQAVPEPRAMIHGCCAPIPAPAVEICKSVEDLYEGGLVLQAYEASRPLGPLQSWPGRTRLIGGRLAMNLGAPRQGLSLHCRLWREMPDDAEVRNALARAASETPPLKEHTGLLATYQRAVTAIAAAAGGLRARFWAWWRRKWPLIPKFKTAAAAK